MWEHRVNNHIGGWTWAGVGVNAKILKPFNMKEGSSWKNPGLEAAPGCQQNSSYWNGYTNWCNFFFLQITTTSPKILNSQKWSFLHSSEGETFVEFFYLWAYSGDRSQYSHFPACIVHRLATDEISVEYQLLHLLVSYLGKRFTLPESVYLQNANTFFIRLLEGLNEVKHMKLLNLSHSSLIYKMEITIAFILGGPVIVEGDNVYKYAYHNAWHIVNAP